LWIFILLYVFSFSLSRSINVSALFLYCLIEIFYKTIEKEKLVS
jgi:hypothetical protein